MISEKSQEIIKEFADFAAKITEAEEKVSQSLKITKHLSNILQFLIYDEPLSNYQELITTEKKIIAESLNDLPYGAIQSNLLLRLAKLIVTPELDFTKEIAAIQKLGENS